THIIVLNKDSQPAKPGEAGRLMIRLPNPQLMLGYWNDPDLTRAAIVRHDAAEWFDSGDLVKSDSDGYVFYLGRADDLINSAGYRIGRGGAETPLWKKAAVKEWGLLRAPEEDRGKGGRPLSVRGPASKPNNPQPKKSQGKSNG